MTQNIILTQQQIQQITKRIAYQIYETFVDETEIVIAGIANSGYTFAQKISDEVSKISDIKVVLGKVEVNKQNPLQEIKTDLLKADYENKAIVLVDDVMNSGATLVYGVKYFLEVPLKKFKTAVLIDRSFEVSMQFFKSDKVGTCRFCSKLIVILSFISDFPIILLN